MYRDIKHNGRTYNIETERHGYRIRFYAYGAMGSLGYVGSYYPATHMARYSNAQGAMFEVGARGPKHAAKLCLAWFLDNIMGEATGVEQTGGFC